MINIDSTTVAVETSAELKTVLEGNNTYTLIYLANDITLTTTKDVVYTSNYLALTIKQNSSFKITTKNGFFRDNGHQCSDILVDKNSTLSIIQTETNGTNAMLTCRGSFTINNKATLYLQANYSNSAPLILFNTSLSIFNIVNPKSVILYNSSYSCLSFSNTSNFNISCGKLDYWLTSPNLISTGIIQNNPLYSWYKSDDTNLSISASVTSSKTTNISWKENTGILFKVLSPLYNGETYSTLINWILTDTLL